MISKKTLFILGAGAHFDYGFPLGNSLLDLIITTLPDSVGALQNNSFFPIWSAVYGRESWALNNPNFLPLVRAKLVKSGHPSIDSFLDAHETNEGIVKTAKLAVAWILRQREFNLGAFHRGNQDWMSYLFTGMFEGVSRKDPKDFLAKNNAYFVTFNYDRTLEFFFANRLLGSYEEITPQYVNEMLLPKIEIHHVYGDLGKFDLEKTNTNNLKPEEFKSAADSIEMMYSLRNERKGVITRVIELFGECKQIAFLGFGFDAQNINVLELNAGAGGKTVASTMVDLTPVEWGRIKKRLGDTEIGLFQAGWDCKTLLRNVSLW